ncbi:hypothetical protein BC826DRAFT_1049504, partial [Russula brevipes]
LERCQNRTLGCGKKGLDCLLFCSLRVVVFAHQCNCFHPDSCFPLRTLHAKGLVVANGFHYLASPPLTQQLSLALPLTR